MKIQKYLVDSTNDDLTVVTEIVALTLECTLFENAENNVKLCKDSAQKIFSFCICM